MDAALIDDRGIEAILVSGLVTADDVVRLRQNVFADGVADLAEARLVFEIERVCKRKDPAWTAFYVDALTDWLVWKAEPKKYVSEDKADLLIAHILDDGRIAGATELELLVNVVHWSLACPDRLAVLALRAVRDSVLDPDHSAYGAARRRGAVDAADVALIRKVLHGGGSDGGYTVSRAEAEVLFDIHEATRGADNAPEWRDLFIKAVTSHLLFPKGPPMAHSAEKALARDRWLGERRGVGDLLAQVGRIAGSFDVAEMKAGWRAADLFGGGRRAHEAEREAEALADAAARERIDAEEAGWLVARIGTDRPVHPDIAALLEFIRANARAIDPALAPLLADPGA